MDQESWTHVFLPEVHASCVLEHWSRSLLVLADNEDLEAEVAREVSQFSTLLRSLPLKFHLRLSYESPALSHLISSHLVHLCALLDGGTTYGLPIAAPRPAATATAAAAAAASPSPLLFSRQGGGLRPSAPQRLATQLAQWGLEKWTATMQRARQDVPTRTLSDPSPPTARQLRGLPGFTPSPGVQVPNDPCVAAQSREVPRGATEGQQGQGAAPIPAATAAVDADAGGAPPDDALPPGVRRRLRCANVPPLCIRAAFEVAMRLAAAARDCMPPLPPLSSPPAPPAPSAPRVEVNMQLLGTRQAAALAVRALRCAREACWGDGEQAGAVAPRAARTRLARFWSVLLAATERACRISDYTQSAPPAGEEWSFFTFEELLAQLAAVDKCASSGLPAGPSADVAAALAAGYLPRIEGMLRSSPVGVTNALRLRQACAAGPGWDGWTQVLAFAPLEETLSLLATAAKRVRQLEVIPGNVGRLLRCVSHGLGGVQPLFGRELLRRLQDLAASPHAGAAAGGGAHTQPPESVAADRGAAGVAAGGPRLRVALSFIALRLLPPLFRKTSAVVFPTVHLGWPVPYTPALLDWVPLLAAARTSAPWAADVLSGPEWDLAGLLGAALGQLLRRDAAVREGIRDGGALSGLRPALVGALRALVALAPALLADALPAAEGLATCFFYGTGGRTDAAALKLYTKIARGAPLRMLRRGLDPAAAPPAEVLESEELLEALTRLVAAGPAPGSAAAVGTGGRGDGGDADACAGSAAAAAAGPGGAGGSDAVAADAAVGSAASAAAPEAAAPEAVGTGHTGESGLFEDPRDWVRVAALLVPPATLAALLPCCANPGCANLAGPTERELGLPVQERCGCGAGAWRYCSEGCAGAHRAAGRGCGAC